MHHNALRLLAFQESFAKECPHTPLACCVPTVHAYALHFGKSQFASTPATFCMQPWNCSLPSAALLSALVYHYRDQSCVFFLDLSYVVCRYSIGNVFTGCEESCV